MNPNAVKTLQHYLRQSEDWDETSAALVFSEHNRLYLTGFPATDGAMLVTGEEAALFMDFRYAEAARRVVTVCPVVDFAVIDDAVISWMQERGIQKLHTETDSLTLDEFAHYNQIMHRIGGEAVPDKLLDDCLRECRIIKSEEEIASMEKAQRITEEAFDYACTLIRPGMTERELAIDIEFFMRRRGAEKVSFDLIVVSGANGSLCHGVPSDKPIEAGDFVTMDTGCVVDGYMSDMTRTVAVGHVSEEQRRVYETVLAAQKAAIAAVKDGVACSLVDKAARDIIEKDYPGTFGHSTGHGVGVQIHEYPRFSKTDGTIARAGMVITVEPGIYLAGKYGVRIEDMVLVTKDGCRDLTRSPKELMIL